MCSKPPSFTTTLNSYRQAGKYGRKRREREKERLLFNLTLFVIVLLLLSSHMCFGNGRDVQAHREAERYI